VEAFALAQKKAIEDANIAFAGGADLIAKSLSPYEQLQAELEKLREKYDAGAISARALGQAQQAAVLIAATAYAGFASDVGHSLVTVFNKNKGIAIAVGTIDAIGAGLKALSAYPPPFSYVAAAAALAAGMAQVARIQSTSSGGGGGGGGSVGSAAAGTGGGTGSSPQLLTVQGINESDRYSGGQMRDLANALIKYQKDGGQVLIK
jgi:hypothetical protein